MFLSEEVCLSSGQVLATGAGLRAKREEHRQSGESRLYPPLCMVDRYQIEPPLYPH